MQPLAKAADILEVENEQLLNEVTRMKGSVKDLETRLKADSVYSKITTRTNTNLCLSHAEPT